MHDYPFTTIPLIASDFNHLDRPIYHMYDDQDGTIRPIWNDQGNDLFDCPIARALKRRHPDLKVKVSTTHFNVSGYDAVFAAIGPLEVDRCRMELLADPTTIAYIQLP